MNALALLDNGSNGTFCSKRLIRALQLETRKTNIRLNTLEAKDVNVSTLAVDIKVEDPHHQDTYFIKGALARDQLNISLDNLVTEEEVLRWPHLHEIASKICLPDVDLADEVHLLIGLDQPDILAPRDLCRGEPGEPYAVLTGLGWTLNGPVTEGPAVVSANYIQTDDTLQQAVEKLWKLEDPVAHTGGEAFSLTDKKVLQLWDEQVLLEDSHYTLPIPFKERPPPLPKNYMMAKHRLDLLGKRLRKNPDLMQQYTKGIHDALQQGYAEEVTDVQ